MHVQNTLFTWKGKSGTPVSSTDKTDCYDIESATLLKGGISHQKPKAEIGGHRGGDRMVLGL